MNKPRCLPLNRNFNGSIAIPREWFRTNRTLSNLAIRIAEILIGLADWDASHRSYGTVTFTFADVNQFIAKGCSRSTLWRTIRELIKNGIIRQGAYDGVYIIPNMEQFLIGSARKRAESILSSVKRSEERVPAKQQPVLGVKEDVSTAEHDVSLLQRDRTIIDGDNTLNNLNTLNKESTGDFFLDGEVKDLCRSLDPIQRMPLLKVVAETFTDNDALKAAEAAIIDFHTQRIARGLPCSHHACRDVLIARLQAVKTSAKVNPIGYFEASLRQLIDDATDAAMLAKEISLKGREPSADFDSRVDFNDLRPRIIIPSAIENETAI